MVIIRVNSNVVKVVEARAPELIDEFGGRRGFLAAVRRARIDGIISAVEAESREFLAEQLRSAGIRPVVVNRRSVRSFAYEGEHPYEVLTTAGNQDPADIIVAKEIAVEVARRHNRALVAMLRDMLEPRSSASSSGDTDDDGVIY